MSLEGWIFMVGFRVIDVGGLILFLVWFYRLRDDDDDLPDDDDGPGGSGPPEPEDPDPAPGGGLPLPLPDASPWPHRRRDHGGDRLPAAPPQRTRRPAPAPVPAHRRPQRAGR